MRTIDFVFFDAGGGHRAAATALKLIIEKQRWPWTPRLVHLRDILAPVDIFRKVLRIDLQEIYNLMLRKGWTLGSEQGLRFMQAVIRLYHGSEVRLIEDWWRSRSGAELPDMVVSVVPNFNRAIFDGLQRAKPGAPYVTILTDLADFPPAFWIERQPQYFICGTERARRQALEHGHPEERVFLTSGMILHPRFYDLPPVDIAAERISMGLDPARPTGLVLFGGYGSTAMANVHDSIEAAGTEAQFIWITGRNEALKKRLESRPSRTPKHVIGFTSEVPRYMRLADFFIGKPGPGSISEAIHMGLPVITVRNAWTLPQERYNADWLIEKNAGIVLRNYSETGQAVRELLRGGTLDALWRSASSMRNSALYEIPPILAGIMARQGL